MSDVSLHGRVAPKSKSINVEANLLAERLQNRTRLREQVRKRLVSYFVGITVVAIVLPPLHRMYIKTAADYKAAISGDKLLTAKLNGVQKQQDSVAPVLQDKKTLDSLHNHAREYLGRLILFFNNVSPEVSLSSLTVQWKEQKMDFNIQAQAISYKAAADFVSQTGKSPEAKQTTLSTMNSDTSMGPDGVNFGLDQLVSVSP
ncbi:MAG TPA: hypothetical protein VGL56_01720 [Fimbriimonadaceae bacterium]